MNDAPDEDPPEEIAQAAATWVLRCDRGLTPAEQDDFSEWLAADPRHGMQLARQRRHWRRLDRMAQWRPQHSARPNPDLLAPPLRRRLGQLFPIALSLAAAAVVGAFFFARSPSTAPPDVVAAARPSAELQRVLPDGSVIELNRGGVVTVHYTATERRVRLEQGEAFFTVAKDPEHPFIVTARGVDVRAVGTTFNVRLDTAAVEVLVTEGRVQVNPPREATSEPSSSRESASEPPVIPLLTAKQRAVVSLAPKPELPQIATLTAEEIGRVLAWQHRLLNFTSSPLAEIVAEFNRRNVVQMVVIDPELASVRIDVALRSDNVEGFVRFLEKGFGARSEQRGDSEILLRKQR